MLDSIKLKHFEHSFYCIFHSVLFHPNVKSSSSKVFYCSWAADQLESSFPFLVVLFVREQRLLQILQEDLLLKLVREVLCFWDRQINFLIKPFRCCNQTYFKNNFSRQQAVATSKSLVPLDSRLL